MKVKAKVNPNHLKYMKKSCIEALVDTANEVKLDLKKSQTMPRDAGNLQNRSTFIDDSKKNSGVVSIVSDTPYFHPEYNFRQDKNANAGGMWFQPYIDGKKKDFATKTFNRLLKGKLK